MSHAGGHSPLWQLLHEISLKDCVWPVLVQTGSSTARLILCFYGMFLLFFMIINRAASFFFVLQFMFPNYELNPTENTFAI